MKFWNYIFRVKVNKNVKYNFEIEAGTGEGIKVCKSARNGNKRLS